VENLFERFREFAKEHPERMVNPEQVRNISEGKRTAQNRERGFPKLKPDT